MKYIEMLQQSLPDGMDGVIIFSEHNRRYFTGFDSSAGLLLVTRDAACFLTDFRYIEAAKTQAAGCEVRLLEDQPKQLPMLFDEFKVKTCGFETRDLPFADYINLKKDLPGVEFNQTTIADDIIERLRMVKSDEEIALIKKSQEITDAAFRHVIEMIKPGVAERDIALEIEFFMKKNGASGPSFDLIVVSGEKSSLPHGVPGERKFQNGDFITMDIGALYHGYCSDMTRTVALGSLSDEQKKVYNLVLKAQLEAEKAVRPGIACNEVDRIARDMIYSAGYTGCFGHGLGHSTGLQIHEQPRFSPTCRTILRKGMIMSVEPGIYLAGRFGVRIEDLVLVSDTGCEILTQSPKELMIL
ncbi:MAG TPA: Xaa-Pro peptidase family protein [Clostridia bacterium]|nr:Xaa-Pro peptidase family protein [Clostridia bacterium]